MASKPNIVRKDDTLLFGSLTAFAVFSALYINFNAAEDTPTQAHWLMWAVALAFAIIWAVLVYSRWRAIQWIDLVTRHNIAVGLNGYKITKDGLEKETEALLLRWPMTLDGIHSPLIAKEALQKKQTSVLFQPGPSVAPLHLPMTNQAARAGYSIGRFAAVAFDSPNMPLGKTAFAHELGHIIYATIVGSWNTEEEFHAFASKYNIGV